MNKDDDRKQTDANRVSIQAVVTLGENRRMTGRARDHEVIIDLPQVSGGDNDAPSPPEYLAIALASCMANLGRAIAIQKEMDIGGIEVTVSGAIDKSAAMDLETENRTGFLGLTVKTKLDADITLEEKEAFFHELVTRCPICDTIQNQTDLSYELA